MNVEPLSLAQARAALHLLEQYLVACPECGKPSALHADRQADGTWTVVRFVCPLSCEIAPAAALSCLPPDEIAS